MKKILLSSAFLTMALCATAQYGGPRLFLDVPSIYFNAPDVEHIGDRLGGGAEIAMNVGTHWGVARLGGGATFTLDPKADDVGKSFLTTPYAILEAGAGFRAAILRRDLAERGQTMSWTEVSPSLRKHAETTALTAGLGLSDCG